MAINDGLAVTCSDLQAVGGTRILALRAWAGGDTVTYDNTDNTITSILDTGGATSTWGVYESVIESSSLNITGTGVGKDVLTYETNISFYLPKLGRLQFQRLKDMVGSCLMVLIITNNDAASGSTPPDSGFDANKVIGVSQKFENLDDPNRNQTYARLTSIEGGTGSAFSDEIGVTVTISCTQFEIPRQYKSAGIVLNATGLSLTTA